jgi:hypothetical protein
VRKKQEALRATFSVISPAVAEEKPGTESAGAEPGPDAPAAN